MIENNISPTHPHHTRLYIILIIIVLFAVAFFAVSKNYRVDYEPVDTPQPRIIKDDDRITLTEEQRIEKEKILTDPLLNSKAKLTAAQKKKKEEQLKALSK